MPPAVRLLCPWDPYVDARSARPNPNSTQRQTSASRPRKLTSPPHELSEVRKIAVRPELVSTGVVPLGLCSILETTHRLRGGLSVFRPRCGLGACLFDIRVSPKTSTKSSDSKEPPTCSATKTSNAPAAQRRNLNSPAPFGFAQGRRKCRDAIAGDQVRFSGRHHH